MPTMKKISQDKLNHIKQLSTDKEYISALAIDQRGSLKRMINSTEGGDKQSREWLNDQGEKNIKALNATLEKTATPWSDLFEVE